MTDVLVCAQHHQSGGILNLTFWSPDHTKQVESVHRQDERGKQQQPRHDLEGGKRITEPMRQVEQGQDQEGLEGEEAEEAVRLSPNPKIGQ